MGREPGVQAVTQDEAHRLELIIVEGFSAVRGDINLLARSTQETASGLEKIDGRVSSLENRRFPEHIVSSVMSVGAVAVALFAALSGR